MPWYGDGDDGVGAVQKVGDGGKVRRGNAHGTSGAVGHFKIVRQADCDGAVFKEPLTPCVTAECVVQRVGLQRPLSRQGKT